MKITEKWLKEHHACESAVIAFKKQKETDSLKIISILSGSKSLECNEWTNWLIGKLLEESDFRKILDVLKGSNKKIEQKQVGEMIIDIIGWKTWKSYLEEILKKHGLEIITKEQSLVWFKDQGFTHIKQTDSFGHFFKCNKEDGFAEKIKYHYDDSSDTYFVKWQSWIGNNTERPKMIKMHPVSDRDDGIFLEAETENQRFNGYIDSGFHTMMVYIQENNDKMIKLLKDNINKRLKKLQN